MRYVDKMDWNTILRRRYYDSQLKYNIAKGVTLNVGVMVDISYREANKILHKHVQVKFVYLILCDQIPSANSHFVV